MTKFEQYPAVAFVGTADVVGIGVSGMDVFFLAFEQAGEDEAACGMQVFFKLRAQGAQRFEEDVGDDEVHLWRIIRIGAEGDACGDVVFFGIVVAGGERLRVDVGLPDVLCAEQGGGDKGQGFLHIGSG